MKGMVFDLLRFSTRDGPGIRTTVFLKGCPLHCLWCHNPESQNLQTELMLRPHLCIACLACVSACVQGAVWVNNGVLETDRSKCIVCGNCTEACYAEAREIVGKEMTVAEVMEVVERDRDFYEQSGGGVTFSGGEPLFQPRFLLALLQTAKENDLHTALDTSGFASWKVIDRIREYVDLFLYDLKVMDPELHQKYTGVDNKLILTNLRKLSSLGHAIILRIPIVPGVNDDESSLRQIGQFAASLPNLDRLALLPYHLSGEEKYHRLGRPYPLPEIQPPSEEKMAELGDLLRKYSLSTKVGE